MTYIHPLVFLLLVGFVAARSCLPKSRGRTILTATTIALFLLSWPPFDWLMSRPLEAGFPESRFPAGSVEAIVVLSGGVLGRDYGRSYRLPKFDTYQRCEYAAWLFHYWHSVPVLVSGGPGAGRIAASTEMRGLLLRAGVPDEMIWAEDRSSSTYENAVFSAQTLRSRGVSRIALVVDARSMLRAAACFRKQGITVVPAASEFRDVDLGSGWQVWLPKVDSIVQNELTLHESLGLVWYWLRGRI
jgi:uncharacterized SAM-binding protein YcdF (DUF218 family)